MTFASILTVVPLALLLACGGKTETQRAPTVAVAPSATPKKPTPQPAPPRPDSTQSFTWQDDVCENTGTFAAGAYTQKQLRDTHRLTTGFMLSTTTVAFNYQNYNAAFFTRAAADLRHEHDSLASVLRGLTVVPTPYWRQLKQLRERQLTEEYAHQQAEVEGYLHPQSWLHNKYYTHCAEYANALASPDTVAVLKAWRKLVDAQKINNGAPDKLEQEYAQQSTQPEGINYAKMKLMTFGWSNCVNDLSQYNKLDDAGIPTEKFRQLFKHITESNCADVD